ncbi:ketoacyl-ACP synthase III [Terribacillus sp. 179-K 1B1 HS]|uniref:ketoacyl-ACP synthase III n=1 Tax=Terribacillus sp. 179-K 1B1 HS TaxID=3142388 RepID=UPI00399F4400
MHQSVIIKEIGVYHPKRKINNEVYIEHFKSLGQDEEKVRNFLKDIGRENRYISEEGETTLSMGVEATKKALEKANLSGEDLDIIVFSSGTPEYLFPPNALIIHNEIQGKREAVVYDANSACVGMVVSVDQVSKALLANPDSKYALIVGAERMYHYAEKNDPFTYGGFGDASCAIILEKVNIEDVGVLGASSNTESQYYKEMLFPACGLSNILDEDVPNDDKLFKWGKLHSGPLFDYAPKQITDLLEKHNVNLSDVKQYLCTQVSIRAMEKMMNSLGENEFDKFYIIGDTYGYTGTSSPFIALNEAVESGKVTRGDYIVFWSIGAGYTACALLMKY